MINTIKRLFGKTEPVKAEPYRYDPLARDCDFARLDKMLESGPLDLTVTYELRTTKEVMELSERGEAMMYKRVLGLIMHKITADAADGFTSVLIVPSKDLDEVGKWCGAYIIPRAVRCAFKKLESMGYGVHYHVVETYQDDEYMGQEGLFTVHWCNKEDYK